MTKSCLHTSLLIFGNALMAVSVIAKEPQEDKISSASKPNNSSNSSSLSAQDVVNALATEAGISLIYDARLLMRKTVDVPITDGNPQARLQSLINDMELDLYPVNQNTFIIAPITPATNSNAEISTLQPPLPVKVPVTANAIDTIIVTAASILPIRDFGSRHIYEIDRIALDARNFVNPAEAIIELPQTVASLTNSNSVFFGPTSGLNLADIRGLGTNHTMVMVNGQRRTPISGGNGTILGVDLSSIAEPFLQSIEVHDRFSGARFGEDAVAGAINFTTRQLNNELRAEGQYGISQRGDAQTFSLSVIGGNTFWNDKARMTVGINHADERGLLGQDRALTSDPFGFAMEGRQAFPSQDAEFLPGFGRSIITPTSRIAGVITDDGRFLTADNPTVRIIDSESDTDSFVGIADQLEPFIGTAEQLYNWLAITNTRIPINRTLGMIDLDYQVSPLLTLRAEAHIGSSHTEANLAPLPTSPQQGVDPVIGDAISIPIDNANVSNNVRNFVEGLSDDPIQSLVVDRRFIELGARRTDVTRRFNDLIIGADIQPSPTTILHANYRYGRNVTRSRNFNLLDRERLAIALNPTQCAQFSGCTLFNPFQSSEPSLLTDFITADAPVRTSRLIQHELSLVLNKEFNELPIPVDHFSASLRSTKTRIIDDAASADIIGNISGAFFNNNINARLRTTEFSTIFDGNLVSDHKYFGSLDYTVTGRYVVVAGPDAKNLEFNLFWKPLKGVELNSAFGSGERSADILERSSIGRSLFVALSDPCISDTPVVMGNCQTDGPLGVGENFTPNNALVLDTSFGNPNLDTEKTRAANLSLSLSPDSWMNNFPGAINLRINWQDIRIQDSFGFAPNSLTRCYNSNVLSDPSCGINPLTDQLFIQRDIDTRQLISVDQTIINGGTANWRGIDFSFRSTYEFNDAIPIQKFWISGLHTWTQRARFAAFNDMLFDDLTGLVDFPKHQSQVNAGINTGKLALSIHVERRGNTASFNTPLEEFQIPSVTSYDFLARYMLNNNVTFHFAIDNLTDRDAPLVAGSGGFNTFPQFYDIVGRRFTIGIKTAF